MNPSTRITDGGPIPAFDRVVPDGGYRWWYVDGVSDDGRHAIVLIAFVGSVFSPWYAGARARGRAEAAAHCALNVAIYSPGQNRWAMTERDEAAIEREPSRFRIGPSTILARPQSLRLEIDERGSPLPRKIIGSVTVHADHWFDQEYSLAQGDRHWWHPLAPGARIEVRFDHPSLSWQGRAYVDSNHGSEPLEHGFAHWYWQRTMDHGATRVAFVTTPRSGAGVELGLRFGADGCVNAEQLAPEVRLSPSGWRIEQIARADADRPCRVLRRLEDTPFYSRTELGLHLDGRPLQAIHESLSLDRFSQPVVQWMLPFRAPRMRSSWRRLLRTERI